MFQKLKYIIGYYLGGPGLQWFYRALFWVSLKGMNIGGGSLVAFSGEEYLVRRVVRTRAKMNKQLVVFDCGANTGEYTRMVLRVCGEADVRCKVYCFEPARDSFRKLVKAMGDSASVTCVPLAVGQSAARRTLFSDAPESGLASVYKRAVWQEEGKEVAAETVEETTLDAFCAEHAIASIDLLKLDIEGVELEALQGAAWLLENGAIEVIEFEFGGADIDARVFWRDFFVLLAPRYNLFRLLKRGLAPLHGYSETDEVFVTTNFVAIKKGLEI